MPAMPDTGAACAAAATAHPAAAAVRRSPPAAALARIALRGVRKNYGALRVTDDISFDVASGEVLGILGPNGAGKSTLFNLMGGDVRPDAGQIVFDGADIALLTPHQRCRLGIGRTYQIPHPFSGMTVFENLLVAASFGAAMRERDAYAPCVEILRRTGLIRKANHRAGALTLLDRKRLELARALATSPKLLLMDEIAGGLTDQEAIELVALIRDIKASGMTIVWIEHVVHALLAVADRLLVINFGAKLAEGQPDAVMADPEVRRVYMGMEV
ncbi:branched-chain amino acid transport system ATP-binding protein [Cupriavidus gilardii J11]|uniref:Branched-chain amino acid transport system ATP-binding protein n=1 Tax=Cupriavidus gilardii J11 TaxID=936133 RepID=A0A562B256_9BURK|nr:branched-chain amino acid transport system ATP-binding protein [Cupriavidus gilardii J11]